MLILFQYLKYYIISLNYFFFSLKFRSIMTFLTSFCITFFYTPYFIFFLKKNKISQIIRNEGPITHLKKKNTPTMGGIIILVSVFISVFFWAQLSNKYIFYILTTIVLYSIIGFLDDYYKIILKNSKGLIPLQKILLQSIIIMITLIYMFFNDTKNLYIQLIIPFVEKIELNLNFTSYLIISYFIILGISNSVNLTDGLDGLVIMPIIFISIGLGLLAYFTGDINLSRYFNINYIKNTKELIIICLAIVGSGLGFLWFNTYPAKIFMGDVGSLTLGYIISIIAILIKQEFLFLIMSSIFIIEFISVIIQVLRFKYSKKRFFLMAPLHHHFELKGLKESCVVVRFWIISFILVLISLIIL
nr:phospho-N-acetylmuramoyl-pentapeptide-transferase [Enterobacteriaceae endosymbiont of Donacia tomentosa]